MPAPIPRKRLRSVLLSVLFVSLPLAAAAAVAAPDVPIPAPPEIGAKSYFVVAVHTGRELASKEPDKRLPPASLTKLMTAYAIFKALDEEQITLDDQVTVSEKAWRTPGSRMFIEVGTRVAVSDLIMGLIVESGNDAAVALAEYVAGSEAVFADVMNRYAEALGMTGSHFVNATGLPAGNHYSTSRDMATLARALVEEFPQYYRWYSVKEFTYNGITQRNRNKLLWRDSSVDGMKTGYTDDAGYCLVASAERDGMRVISAVLGTSSPRTRIDGSQAVLNYAFRFYETRLLYHAGEAITQARIWKAADQFTELGLPEDLYITIPRGTFDDVQSVLNMPAVLVAPVAQGQPLARLLISLDGANLVEQPLRALTGNPQGSLWQRARDGVMLWFE